MAWWDSHHRLLDGSPRSKTRLAMGDAFPRLEPAHADRHMDMERERVLLSPVFEEQSGPPTAPALVVHVDIRFTDPVIRSRYCRNYGSSPGFQATNKICRGLVRRIERCSEELITRKDSGALDMFKGDTYERKSQRFEMTFRVIRRGKGEWAERTYRSYQKQPLTVAHTREVTLAVHRMIGLFLRRHDKDFRWLDSPVPEADSDQSESASSFGDGPLSLLSVPASRFIEATQTFESLPGYSIDLCFRSRNPQRQVATFERRTKVTSTQTTPLTLLMSEDLLWSVLQFANQSLDAKRRELDDYLQGCRLSDHAHAHPEDDTFELSIRVVNRLGPAHDPVQKLIRGKFALFRHPEARDCETFFCELERHLSRVRDEADATLNGLNDFELRIVELKGVGWTLREPAKFTVGPEASYGRRTIRAALDRIQTGVGDVIRGHNIAIHIAAHKRGHLVLDKAIVAHEKRGRPKETFASLEDAQEAFVSRLRARIQKDLDKVFEDSCSIDDIPEDEDDYFSARPITPQQPESAVFDGPSPRCSPSSVRSSPAKRPALANLQASPRPRAQRVFSLSRRSMESVRSIDYLTTARDGSVHGSSRPSSVASEHVPPPHEPGQPESPLPDSRGLLLAAAEIKPTRAFSLVSRRSSMGTRVSSASTLAEDHQTVGVKGFGHQTVTETTLEQQLPEQLPDRGQAVESMTSSDDGPSLGPSPLGISFGEATPIASSATAAADQQADARSTESKHAPPVSSPGTFVDAQENVGSSMPGKDIKSNLAGAPTGLPRSRGDDGFSTAPSTPELSTGSSSPRQSLLITPGDKDAVLRHVYPESEPEGGVVQLHPETVPEPDCKEDGNRPAEDESPDCQQASPQLAAGQNLTAEEPGHAPGDASTRRMPGDPASDLSHQTPPDAVCQQGHTSRPSTPSPEHKLADSPKKPEGQSEVQTTHLGAELAAGPDGHSPLASCFPTAESEVQTSDPGQEPAHASSELPISSTQGEPVQGRLESPLAPEEPDAHRSEPAAEDKAMGHGPDDATGALVAGESKAAGGPEPAAVLVVAEVATGMAQPGTESFLEPGRVDANGEQVPKVVDAWTEVDGMGLAPGNEVAGGPEPSATVQQQQQQQQAEEEEPAAEENACRGIDSAEKSDHLGDDASTEALAPEIVSDGDPRETTGAETDAAPDLNEASTGDKLDAPTQNPVIGVPDFEGKAKEPEAVSHVRMDGAGVQDPSGLESEIHADAEDEASGGLRGKAFGPEIRVDGISGALGDDAPELDTTDVCTEPGAPGTNPRDKRAAAATCANELSPSGPDTSGSSADETGKAADAGSSAETSSLAEPATVETPTPEAAPSPAPQATKAQPDLLAPRPDVSTLCNLSPVPTRSSIFSDAASFANSSTIPAFRNSVDTIRPSTDEPRQHPAGAEQLLSHTDGSDSRPQTAGYLGVGLRRGSRFVEVGLRGALGDVEARRRMSLPLLRCLSPDGEAREKSRPSAPASEAGAGDGGRSGDGQSVLPRMILLLAGVVAVGKIMKKAAE
ncbi:hypothetical protein L209DRAFT_757535 [Thermothelomyces heterothallicus CBS 203.75]